MSCHLDSISMAYYECWHSPDKFILCILALMQIFCMFSCISDGIRGKWGCGFQMTGMYVWDEMFWEYVFIDIITIDKQTHMLQHRDNFWRGFPDFKSGEPFPMNWWPQGAQTHTYSRDVLHWVKLHSQDLIPSWSCIRRATTQPSGQHVFPYISWNDNFISYFVGSYEASRPKTSG